MKLSEEKIDIIQKVISLDDEEKLDRIHEILTDEHPSDSLTTSEIDSIGRGLKYLEKGKKISYEEFKIRLHQWVTS